MTLKIPHTWSLVVILSPVQYLGYSSLRGGVCRRYAARLLASDFVASEPGFRSDRAK